MSNNFKDPINLDNFSSEYTFSDLPGRVHYFVDGLRIIDCVLVYKDDEMQAFRDYFLENLNLMDIGIEQCSETINNECIYFIKLYVPPHIITKYAKKLNLRKPIKNSPTEFRYFPPWAKAFPGLKAKAPHVPFKESSHLFMNSKEECANMTEGGIFFTPINRQRIMWAILSEIKCDSSDESRIGVEHLLDNKTFTCAFQLHESANNRTNMRSILTKYWANFGQAFKFQPIDHIKDYFGESVAVYFSWLETYTVILLIASIFGIAVFIYGLLNKSTNNIISDVCNSDYTMCEECDYCPLWELKTSCSSVKLKFVFDNLGAMVYSVLICLCGVTFVEIWKRQKANYGISWGKVSDYNKDRIRPAYYARVKKLGDSQSRFEKLFSPHSRMIVSVILFAFMIVVIVMAVISVVIYRVVVAKALRIFPYKYLQTNATLVASGTGSIINFIIIKVLGLLYQRIAVKITEWELHKTQKGFDKSYLIKIFAFQFVNFTFPLMYTAFIKTGLAGYSQYRRIFDTRLPDCGSQGCMGELAVQLAVFMVGNQVINNIMEIWIPKIKVWRNKSETKGHSEPWLCDYSLCQCPGLIHEYSEMVIQFALLMMFSCAFPLAPFFAFLNNILEIRVDASKFVKYYRRTVVEQPEYIWWGIIDWILFAAVLTNAVIISFSSEILPRLLYAFEYKNGLEKYVDFSLNLHTTNGTSCRYFAFVDDAGTFNMFYWKLMVIRLAFVIVFQNVVFALQKLITFLIPDVSNCQDPEK